jgi:cell division protease FtsH
MNTPARPLPPSERAGGDPPAQPRLHMPAWLWWLIAALMLAWNSYSLLHDQVGDTSVTLPYSDFIDLVRAGSVSSVTLNNQIIQGTFNQPVAWPPAAVSPTPAPNATSGPSPAPSPTYTSFSTIMPPYPDDQLLPALEQNGVTVSVQAPGGAGWLLDLAMSALPTLLFIGLLLFMSRQAQRGQQTIMGFGGSKARRYSEERPTTTFAAVAGADEAKSELQEIVTFLQRPERYRAIGARLPRGVLLIGPPGTGKTLLARAVAGEARVPFFSISATEFVEMFVGVGASRVRDLFEKAKKESPAIVFVDEIDAVGRQRGAGLGGGNDEREQTLNQLLVEMDGFDEKISVIVLAATNRPDVLDPALLRPGRFDRQVIVALPDRAGRDAILQIHTRQLELGADVDLLSLARRTPGFSGADLANLANEAALCAARRGAEEVTGQDFDEAIDKIVLGTRQAALLGEEERPIVAYHEAGHALVARVTPGTDPINKVTIIPHGRALGVTEQLPDDDRHNYSRDYLLGRLAVMLGGRSAEELVFDQPTTGAESDLKNATSLARRMIGLWGMSDEIGPVSYGVGETHPFLGRELAAPRDYAEATAAELDRAVRALIEKAHGHARSLLARHRDALDALAHELVIHETVDAERLDAILADQSSMTDSIGVGRSNGHVATL